MKLTSLLASSAVIVSLAAAQQQGGFIYTIDQSVISSSTATINSETASSILARRRGLTAGRALGTSDETVLDTLKNYGGWQQPLISQQDEEAPGKLFIRISGFDGGVMDLSTAMPDLWVEEPTLDLKTDFAAQPARADGVCEYTVLIASASKDVEVVFSYPSEGDLGCLEASEIPQLPLVLALQSVIPASADALSTTILPLKRILTHLLATQGVESTILLLPSKLLPQSTSTHSHAHARRQEETPLSLNPQSKDQPVHILASNKTSNATNPLPRVIPACFESLDSCNNVTNFCSGHGDCYEARNKCFRCKCGSTVVRTNDDGTTKSVHWGGMACEKKDVSVPFILFAGFGVIFTALVVGAIGMLYGMGSENLPSVLSAGVAGPTARK